MANLICITGYTQDSDCMHCGRELRHVIQTDAGSFGAACFAKHVTKPRVTMGKKYRLSTDAVISLARQAHNPRRFGLTPEALMFEGVS